MGSALEFRGRARRGVPPEEGDLERHCAEVGRDPAEITLSSHVRYAGGTRGHRRQQAAALAEVGAELGIVYLPPPLDPSVLEPLAIALSSL